MNYKLSIMIPTIIGREQLLSDLVCELIRQCGSIKSTTTSNQNGCDITVLDFEDVEIIIACDNRQIPTGCKRNLLLSLAKNDFVVSADDDDFLYPDFLKLIMEAIQSNPDCVGTRGLYTLDNQHQTEWRLSKDYANETIFENGVAIFLRTSNHLTPVKRELALQAGFPNHLSNAEDKWYSERLRPLLHTEVHIHPYIYHYRCSSHNKSYQ